MRLDYYGNPIYNEHDLFQRLYQGYELPPKLYVEDNQEIKQLQEISHSTFVNQLDSAISINDFDNDCQQNWFMPEEYKILDIETHITELCPPWDPEHSRVKEELDAYKARNMLDLLRWLKYFVDTARANNIVWGVGRGSSVASYVLYLLGVHKINSIEYNLDWRDFLR